MMAIVINSREAGPWVGGNRQGEDNSVLDLS